MLLLGAGVGGDDQPVRSSVVRVVAGDQVEHGRGELVGEGGPVLGGAEADVGGERQGRQALALLAGAQGQAADLPHDPGGQRDQVARGQPVGGARRVGRGRADGGR
jgi:hypothetical protein